MEIIFAIMNGIIKDDDNYSHQLAEICDGFFVSIMNAENNGKKITVHLKVHSKA